jgi:alpha-amylase/alpha-mannosidase (GH57 family)
MQKLKFLFGTHNHQPIGNFEHIFVEAYHRAYLPFLETLAVHPRIKFSVHYSGVLYDWIREKHPEFFDLLNKLVRRGQLEILSGGYYEPILTVIPDEDKIGQIEMSNQFIKENFWKAARGIWLTERVWEPGLPKILARAGVEYVLVDDDHLLQAGVASDKLAGYYITEEEGETVRVFPINRNLREAIPFRPPEEIIKYLKSIPNPDGSATAVFVDDGEKFGLRPETHQWIYEEGYLEKLLSLLEENSDWIEFTTFSDYLDEYPSQGRIYLPASSYFEMMEWATLDGAEGGDCGGHFRNFFVKYPEANNMHKKMLYVSSRLQTLSKGRFLIGGHRRNEELKKARQDLYKGQCNCAYWRGIFGGLYLNHLRHAIYSHLIRSETELEKIGRGGKPHVELTVTDFDKDGKDEVILSNNLLNLYFSPARGGSLFELDYKPRAFNLINTLDTDQHTRVCLLDHFLSRRADLESFNEHEAGDFVKGSYAFMPRRKEAEIGLRLSRKGRVEGASVKVEKSISLFSRQSIFTVEYEMSNLGEEPDEFWFGVEFNLSLLAGNSHDRYYIINGHDLEDRSLQSRGETGEVGLVKLVDEWSGFAVSLEMSRPALLWRFPIENDCGYQSSVVLPSWKFRLGPQETWSVKISFRVEE